MGARAGRGPGVMRGCCTCLPEALEQGLDAAADLDERGAAVARGDNLGRLVSL